jgi:hypothetical protein
MSKPLIYKGYAASIEFDPEDRLFFGRITGIADIVTFHGETVDELFAAFMIPFVTRLVPRPRHATARAGDVACSRARKADTILRLCRNLTIVKYLL